MGSHERRQALAISEVQRVIPLVTGFADWDRPDGGITHVVVVGLDAEDGGLAPWNLRSGNWIDIKSSKGVGVDRTYLSDLGVSGIGSHAGIEFGINSLSVVVKALTQGIRSFTQAPYVFTTTARAREIFGVSGDMSTFFLVTTEPGADLVRIKHEIAARLSSDVEVLTKAEFRKRSISHWLFGTKVGVSLIFGTILGVIIGAVIVAQTLYSATLDHIKEFAVLRMFGCSASYLYRIILLQASIVSVVGFALGLVCVLLVSQWSQESPLPVIVPSELRIAMLVVSLAIGASSAIIAVLKVLRIEPATMLMR